MIINKSIRWSIIILTSIIFFILCSENDHTRYTTGSGNQIEFKRIISLAPSITETLFALDLRSKIMGVTRFCNFPPEAEDISRVGGYLDPNYEAIIALKPDLVILLPEHESVMEYLSKLNIEYLQVNNKTVEDILETIKTIGDKCGAEPKASSLINSINEELNRIERKNVGNTRPKVLISIGRTMGAGSIKDVYIAGKGTFYDQIINLAGGINAYEGVTIEYPMLSAEGLLHMNPDIIIDLVANMELKGYRKQSVLDEWKSIPSLKAAENNGIHILTNDYIVIPGPRFILLTKDIARIINPNKTPK